MYLSLISRFLNGSLSAPQFDSAYFDTYRSETRRLDDRVHQVLSDLFFACGGFVEQPELRTSPEDLDEARLLEAARTARARLTALGV